MHYTRRDFLGLTARGVLAGGLSASGLSALSNVAAAARPLHAWVGTHARRGQAEGIYALRLDPRTGALSNDGPREQTPSSSYLAVHPDKNLLYAVSEGPRGQQGRISAFAVEPQTRQLQLLNSQSTQGGGPCHVSLDRTGAWALVANYGSGNVAVFPLATDGRLETASSVVEHGTAATRKSPHAHMIRLSPDNRYALAADLGLDRVMVHAFDAQAGTLTRPDHPWVETAPGAGPRHLAFHPGGLHVFVINEKDSTLTAYAYDPYRGTLAPGHTVSTLPDGYTGRNDCAALRVAQGGRFVYGSNRGHNSIVTFAFDAKTGQLQKQGFAPTLGDHPRDFNIDPSGAFLLVANTYSGTIHSFRIDPDSGSPLPTGHAVELPQPMCIAFARG